MNYELDIKRDGKSMAGIRPCLLRVTTDDFSEASPLRELARMLNRLADDYEFRPRG